MFKIGVVSDTHNFLDPRVHQLFTGVEHILHAGDIGSRKIILELETIAPVTCVAGNTDDAVFNYPATERVRLAEKQFLLRHIVIPRDLSPQLQSFLARERPDVVVFGHTHQPFSSEINGILFFNPGYAGKQRFSLQRSVAILELKDNEIRSTFLKL
jgi:putative phosphoesterase